VTDVIDEARRPVQADLLLPANQQSQQAIKSDKVIDMRVRHEYLRQAVDLSRRQSSDVAKVEQQRAVLEQRLDVEGRVSGSPVDQAGM
jgi:hypothetical protein